MTGERPTAVEALTLPVDELIDMLGATVADLDEATLERISPGILGVLIDEPAGPPVLTLPSGQSQTARDGAIRLLVLRYVTEPPTPQQTDAHSG